MHSVTQYYNGSHCHEQTFYHKELETAVCQTFRKNIDIGALRSQLTVLMNDQRAFNPSEETMRRAEERLREEARQRNNNRRDFNQHF